MNSVNPKFILRNYLLENAIRKAEKEDYSEVRRLLDLARTPFSEDKIPVDVTNPPPKWAYELCVSCSS